MILAGRKQESLDDTIQMIKAEPPSASLQPSLHDLQPLDSVRRAAEVHAQSESIDVLIKNATVMSCPYHTTKDRIEDQFCTNHIGPILSTNLIFAKASCFQDWCSTYFNVSSIGHVLAPVLFDNSTFDNGKAYKKWWAYDMFSPRLLLFSWLVNCAIHIRQRVLLAPAFTSGIAINFDRYIKPGVYAAELTEMTEILLTGAVLSSRLLIKVLLFLQLLSLIPLCLTNLDLAW
ncbi:hypothetical protein BGW37DRAFT_520370 [Umbelopsis sp. PMI_123]|nr:hypothetical protein BGW37DRAFT_520370 [Umbelopsis sp. PMI_123]